MSDPKKIPDNIFGKLLALLFLKSAPEDLPYSLRLTFQLVAVYLFSGIVVLQTTLAPDDMYAGILLGVLVQYVFTYVVLLALNKAARLMQTFAALIGVSLLFNLLSWPVFSILADNSASESLMSTMSLMFLLLISWEVLVKAHIFKHALEMKMFAALALSFSLFFISLTLSQLLLPVETAS